MTYTATITDEEGMFNVYSIQTAEWLDWTPVQIKVFEWVYNKIDLEADLARDQAIINAINTLIA